jgi:chemotaxis protein methyltransferase CheR
VSCPRELAGSISPQLFAIFAHLIEQSCGVHYSVKDRAILAAKLEAHALELGHDSLLDYYYRLRYDDPGGLELRKLVEATVVHETYFFRELAPIAQLVKGHLADVIRARGRARVWSAACSTGEEPFTLAMLLDDAGLLDRVELLASDVSASAIARATAGRHGSRALRDGHPAGLTRRYLESVRGELSVASRIRDAVAFSTVNLLDDDAVRRLGRFDAILCRNVLIYFHDDQIVRVVERLARSLEPTGLIAVGVSESLLRFGTALVCEQHGDAFFYRRAS